MLCNVFYLEYKKAKLINLKFKPIYSIQKKLEEFEEDEKKAVKNASAWFLALFFGYATFFISSSVLLHFLIICPFVRARSQR